MRVVLATLLLGVVAVVAGCGGHGSVGGSGKLEAISSVDQFGRAFNDRTGHPRLVLLLSPT
jgi:Na+/serine symporter